MKRMEQVLTVLESGPATARTVGRAIGMQSNQACTVLRQLWECGVATREIETKAEPKQGPPGYVYQLRDIRGRR